MIVPLPVIHVMTPAGTKTYRLPLDLGHWAWLADQATNSGSLTFPATLRFGFVEGRHTANFVRTSFPGGR